MSGPKDHEIVLPGDQPAAGTRRIWPMALAALAGSWMFEWPGTIATVIISGCLMATTGFVGMMSRPPEMERAPPEVPTAPGSGHR